jgi:hypothetical protein
MIIPVTDSAKENAPSVLAFSWLVAVVPAAYTSINKNKHTTRNRVELVATVCIVQHQMITKMTVTIK